MKAVIIGGGIIGLSSAYYLQKSGWEVTIIDKGNFLDNCSYGNAGYICPSHFTQLATPGIVKKGMKWMWNSKSPFYVQPRFDLNLFSWGMKFIQSATKEKVEAAEVPLRDIALLSQHEYESWNQSDEFDFAYEKKGLLEIYQTEKGAEHAHHAYEKAKQLGLTDTFLLNKEEVKKLEPQTTVLAEGGVMFKCDAHCFPDKLMGNLIKVLKSNGVEFVADSKVVQFEHQHGKVSKVMTEKNVYIADEIVIATGSWSRETVKLLDIKIPLIPGRGYSITLRDSIYQLNYPTVLIEGRVAITPMDGNKIRFGGTMEITSHKTPMRMNRVQGILDAVKRYYPEYDVPLPSKENIWYGYRPCSADGLPFIGRSSKYTNVTIATGHSMLGLSLGAGTGKLVDEIVNNQSASMDIKPFSVERFR